MLVSVLLSVWNGAATVARAVESIQAQTFTEWELIAVDDGSSDATAEILEAFARNDRRIHLLRNEANRGQAASLNGAFRVSRGELIARLDADDTALPDRFAAQVEFLAAHPEVAILGGGAELVDRGGRPLRVQKPRTQHAVLVAEIYERNPFIHPAVMMRREVLEQLGGYDESFSRAQDYDLWLRAYRRFVFANLDIPLIRYTFPECSTWASSVAAARALLRAGVRDGARWRGIRGAARHFGAYLRQRLLQHDR